MEIEYLLEDFISMFEYHSSDIGWCERNYVYNSNIVEFWNTITSLFIILIGVYGLIRSSKYPANKYYYLLIFIGIFSAYFHATLSFIGQCLDELSITLIMIAGNCALYSNDKVGLALIFIFVLIQLCIQFVYSEYNRFVLFVYAIFFLNKFYLMLLSSNKTIRRYASVSAGLFVMGAICWVMDFTFCVRDSPFNFHGMWHIFVGLMAYCTIETCVLYQKLNIRDVCTEKCNYKQTHWTNYYEEE